MGQPQLAEGTLAQSLRASTGILAIQIRYIPRKSIDGVIGRPLENDVEEVTITEKAAGNEHAVLVTGTCPGLKPWELRTVSPGHRIPGHTAIINGETRDVDILIMSVRKQQNALAAA